MYVDGAQNSWRAVGSVLTDEPSGARTAWLLASQAMALWGASCASCCPAARACASPCGRKPSSRPRFVNSTRVIALRGSADDSGHQKAAIGLVMKRFGRLDILVNDAAAPHQSRSGVQQG